MDIKSIRQQIEEQRQRALRFDRSVHDIKRELRRLHEELAEQHHQEAIWVHGTLGSPVPMIGAGALARTLRDAHRIKSLIKGLEHDLRNVEQLRKDAASKTAMLEQLAKSAEAGNTYAFYQAGKVVQA